MTSHIPVSVIVTAYKRPRLLRRALRSVVAQASARRPLEVLVSEDDDDLSSAAVVDEVATAAPPGCEIRYVQPEGGLRGVAASRNRALARCRGEWVVFLDDDDTLCDFAIEHLVGEGERRGADLCAGHYRIVREDAEWRAVDEQQVRVAWHGTDPLLLRNQFPIGGFAIRRAAITTPFSSALRTHEDWLFLLDNLATPRHRPGVCVVDATVLTVHQSAGDWRRHRNTESGREQVACDYARIYGLHPAAHLVSQRMAVLSSLAPVTLEALLGAPPREAPAQDLLATGPLRVPDGPGLAPPVLAGLRLAVVIHLFYADDWPEFHRALAELPAHAQLFVTAPVDRLAWVRRIVTTDVPSATVVGVHNRGRDLGALVALLQEHDLGGFDHVLKLHTKRSPHLGPAEGARWRRSLIRHLLPPGRVPDLLASLEAAPDVGLAGPLPWMVAVKDAYGLGSNAPGLQALADRLQVRADPLEMHFVQGTMFWVRGAVLAQLRDAGLTQEDFEAETGQLDGTLAHALERGFALLALKAGLRAAPLPVLDSPEPLPPARRGASGQLLAWLEARTPDERQAASMRARLAGAGQATSIGIVVLDPRGDADGLATTCDSLAQAVRSLPGARAVVVSACDTPPPLAGGPRVVRARPAATAAVVNAEVARLDTQWILLVEAGERLTDAGLLRVALELVSAEGCRAVFADAIVRAADGSMGALFRPAFNLDLLLSFPAAMARHVLVARDAWERVGGLDDRHPGALELSLLLRLVDDGGIAGFGHVAEPLVVTPAPAAGPEPDEEAVIGEHLRRRGYAHARLTCVQPRQYRIEYGHEGQPLVSIIVPTKDQLPMLRRCVESLLEQTRYPHYELLIVDNRSEDADARAWLDGVAAMDDERVRVLSYPHPFNFSAINNMAAREARGEYLVLLNNDTAVLDPGWLDALLNHAQRPEVGIVGAKLLYPDGRIQHAGVVLGLRGPAEHVFSGDPRDAQGYMQRLRLDQNYSAVTAACLMIRKAVYEAVGGMDEQAFAVSYNDVDLCLKAVAAGYLTVWTPHAVLLHEGSVSQRRVDDAAHARKLARFTAEQDALYARWLPQIARDPAYNPNLSLTGRGFDFEADTALTLRPLPWRPQPVVLAHPADRFGCGEYRVLQPMRALADAGLVDGVVRDTPLLPAELARLDPDVVVLQRQIGEQRLEAMRRLKAFSRAFKVYELDDYLPNLPLKSAFRQGIPKDAMRSLRRGLGCVDRFVVSTPALAEAFEGLHADIRVVKNRLLPSWWRGLAGERRRGTKPRVGWAGGAGHGGDLSLIVDVVKALADEVEWVFFGMCPDALLDVVHEVHAGVPIEQYPAKLAGLNLDLGLAPLEENLFNECKSNLRLLEYGACGVPVVCSDLRCYREDDLPVTRVKNRFREWVGAIRDHVADLDEAGRRGDALRERVHADWMLAGDHLQTWLSAWTRP